MLGLSPNWPVGQVVPPLASADQPWQALATAGSSGQRGGGGQALGQAPSQRWLPWPAVRWVFRCLIGCLVAAGKPGRINRPIRTPVPAVELRPLPTAGRGRIALTSANFFFARPISRFPALGEIETPAKSGLPITRPRSKANIVPRRRHAARKNGSNSVTPRTEIVQVSAEGGQLAHSGPGPQRKQGRRWLVAKWQTGRLSR